MKPESKLIMARIYRLMLKSGARAEIRQANSNAYKITLFWGQDDIEAYYVTPDGAYSPYQYISQDVKGKRYEPI